MVGKFSSLVGATLYLLLRAAGHIGLLGFHLFTSYLVAALYGVFWGILSFVVFPIGFFVVPFFIGSWPYLIVALAIAGVSELAKFLVYRERI